MKCETHGEHCDGLCIDPNVDNGMMTKVWGPPGWLFLHSISFGYPYTINHKNPAHKNKKAEYATFFNYVGTVLPCKYCRESYLDFLKEYPVENHLNTREEITKWLYNIHNRVNDKLGVPKCKVPSFDEIKTTYERFRARCKKTTQEEKENNQAKGCVTPADGTKKRCVVKVVNCSNGDITRHNNASYNVEETSDDYILVSKNTVNYIVLLILIIIGILLYMYSKNKNVIRKLKF
jgi:hypothetical protein